MQPSDSSAALAAVETEMAELESLCAVIERALVARDWDAFGAAMADSRRVTHALQNAMEAAHGERDAAFDDGIFGRARRVYAIRENQLARLRTYNAAVGDRLRQIAAVRSVSRRLGRARQGAAALDALR